MPQATETLTTSPTTNEVKCPRCRRALSYVEPVRPETYGLAVSSTIAVPHESHIYECSEHGYWRLFVSGRIEKVARL
jgi:hypothetical protein